MNVLKIVCIIYTDISCFDLTVDSSNKHKKHNNKNMEKLEFFT